MIRLNQWLDSPGEDQHGKIQFSVSANVDYQKKTRQESNKIFVSSKISNLKENDRGLGSTTARSLMLFHSFAAKFIYSINRQRKKWTEEGSGPVLSMLQ